MLHEINQAEKDKYYVISFICGIKSKKTNSQTQGTDLWLTEVGVGDGQNG